MGTRLMLRSFVIVAAALLASSVLAADFIQQNPTRYDDSDFERNAGVIKQKAPTQRFITGLTDTMVASDRALHWTGRVIDVRAQTLPACTSGTDKIPRTITDDVGLAAIYPITLTPASGTIAGETSYKIDWAFGGVQLHCDGVDNYSVTTTTRVAPPASSLPERTVADINSYVTVINKGLGNQPQQISLANIVAESDGSRNYVYKNTCSVTAPCLVESESANGFHIGQAGGDIYLDLQGLAFRQPYLFLADGTSTIYLDPGKNGLFIKRGGTGQMLQMAPGDVLTVYRYVGGLFFALVGVSPDFNPGVMPVVAVSTVGDYAIPANGAGKLYFTNAATNFTIQDTQQQFEYCVGNKSGGTATVEPGGAQVILPYGTTGAKITVPTNGILCLNRWTTGIWVATRRTGSSTIESTVNSGSAVDLTVSGTAYNITSIDLPPGRWDITGAVTLAPAVGTTSTAFSGWASTTSATAPSKPNDGGTFDWHGTYIGSAQSQYTFGPKKLVTTTAPTTTVYLSARSSFTGSTTAAFGYIRATAY